MRERPLGGLNKKRGKRDQLFGIWNKEHGVVRVLLLLQLLILELLLLVSLIIIITRWERQPQWLCPIMM